VCDIFFDRSDDSLVEGDTFDLIMEANRDDGINTSNVVTLRMTVQGIIIPGPVEKHTWITTTLKGIVPWSQT